MACGKKSGAALKYSYKCVCPGCIARKVVTKFKGPDGILQPEQLVDFYGEHDHSLDHDSDYVSDDYECVPPHSTVRRFPEYKGGRLPYTRTKHSDLKRPRDAM